MAKAVNFKFHEISVTTAVLFGLEEGEYSIGNLDGNRTLAMKIPAPIRKRETAAFASYIQESIEYDAFYIETGFYPVKKDGKTVLAFYHEGKLEIISRVYARDVRLSGGIIDLDAEVERKEVLKHLQHLEKEVRKLRKGQKEGTKPSSIDEEVERLTKERPNLDKLLSEMRAASGK